jgi:4-amino-4-deoxy-L-arabinose transferase-like glycosyltransferase
MSVFSSRIARVVLVVFAGVLCLLGLTGGELIRNEGLRARLAAEAWGTGNWLVPTLQGEPHLAKPPGMTVLIGLCSVFTGGVTPLTARLPSVLAGLLVIGLIYRLLADRLGTLAGVIAAAILPCSGMWLDRVPSAEIDLVQMAWVTGSLLCLLRAVEVGAASRAAPAAPRAERGLLWWLAAFACVAGGLFTKWTAPAFFYLTAVPFLALQGRLSLLLRWPHLAGASLVAVLALGWLAFAGHVAGWSVLVDTLGREALLRLSPGHHPRPYPWDELVTFPLSFLAANLPWSLFALVTLRPSFARLWDERTRRLVLLCQAWLWANLLFWTLAPGHRPRHMLPSQPALAILAALVWIAWVTGKLSWPIPRIRPAGVLAGLLVAWLAVKLVFVSSVLPARQVHRHPQLGGEMLARLVPEDEMLYLLRLKDDGLLFYYGRPAHRLHAADEAPAGAWCLLTETEWGAWQGARPERVSADLRDGQGSPLVLVRLPGRENER